MGSFDELLGEIESAGVDPSLIDRLKSATAASPIRQERDAARAEAEAARKEAAEYRSAVMAASFEKAGISINPAALNLPPDLDFRNVEAVREWGSTMGLTAPTTRPSTPPSEQQGHEQFVNPGAGSGIPDLDATRIREMADLRNKRYANGQAPNLNDIVAAVQAAGWEDTRGR